jgi:aspartate 1-decarboxylase
VRNAGGLDPRPLLEGSLELMLQTLLKAKLHRACVTHAELDYEGSCAIDEDLLEAAGIREYEQIQIYNIANGERFVTYAIRAEAGSRIISVNGAAAHKASPGDRIIICTYATLNQQELVTFKPTLVYLDEENHITHSRNSIPLQVA